ncbi:uncharacterized protein LY79DRAFT_500682, partial [Colletotrichum navitas]
MASLFHFTILLFHLLGVFANTLQQGGYRVKLEENVYKVFSEHFYDNQSPLTVVQFDESETSISVLEAYNQFEPAHKGKLTLLDILRELCNFAGVNPHKLEAATFKMRETQIRKAFQDYIKEHPLKRGVSSITITKHNSAWNDFKSTPYVQTVQSLVGNKEID